MSEAEGKNEKESNGKGAGPTRSFDGSVPGPGGQIGPFRIERELGRGAMVVVYLAHDTKLNRPVAIKSLPAELMKSPCRLSGQNRQGLGVDRPGRSGNPVEGRGRGQVKS